MPTPTASVKVNPLTGALIDPPVATFAAINGLQTTGGSDAKDSVRLATTGAITLASRTSTTLTTAASTLTADGSAVVNGDRLLVKDAPTGGGGSAADCGIFTVSGVGTTVVLTRTSDFDVWTEIVGAFVTVESGTVNAGTQWLCNVVAGGTLGTTAITFVVPKNFVDLTTAQSIGGLKVFTDTVEATYFQAGSIGSGSYLELGPTTFTIFSNTYASALVGPGLGMSGAWTWTLPDASGTLATTTGNVATATALATARSIFNISFNGTANVAGDAVNTGHFASIPGTGAAGHFVTQNGTAPTLIAGRSAWYSDGSGVPSFKNGTGTPVTLVRSSDLGTGIATFLTTPSSANLAAAVTDETGSGALVFGTSPTITTSLLCADASFTAFAGATTLLTIGGTGASASMFAPSTLDATSSTTGAIRTSGGISAAKSLFVGGSIAFADGTISVPGIYFASDIDTGIYREASNRLSFVAGGSLACRIGFDGTLQYFGHSSSPINRVNSTGEVYIAMQSATGAHWGVQIGNAAARTYIRAAASQTASIMEWQNSGGTALASIDKGGNPSFPKTITAAATTGAQTIDKASGSVNFAAAATSLVVTNSLCTTSSVIHCTIATNDATAANVKAVAAAGSFTIYLTTAPTAETRVNFLLTN